MNKYILVLTIPFLFFMTCTGKSVVVNNPHIDAKYIVYKHSITSMRNGDLIVPSYRLMFHNASGSYIRKFQFTVFYYYGQSFNYSDKKVFSWSEKDSELQLLNAKKDAVVEVKLNPVNRENNTKVLDDQIYLEPDGELLDVSLDMLTIDLP